MSGARQEGKVCHSEKHQSLRGKEEEEEEGLGKLSALPKYSQRPPPAPRADILVVWGRGRRGRLLKEEERSSRHRGGGRGRGRSTRMRAEIRGSRDGERQGGEGGDGDVRQARSGRGQEEQDR